jgi:hypothetical protein
LGTKFYSDDFLDCFAETILFLTPFTRRSEFYARYGFELKKDDDFVSDTPVGHKFLCAEIVLHQGKHAPKYNLGRIWSAIVHNSVNDPVGLYNKMCSLLMLTTFNGKKSFDQVQNVLISYVRIFDAEYGLNWTSRRATLDEQLPLFKRGIPFIPTYDWCINFWLGYETGSRFAIEDPSAVFQLLLKHLEGTNPSEALN